MMGDGGGLMIDDRWGVKKLTGRGKNSEREGLYRERSYHSAFKSAYL